MAAVRIAPEQLLHLQRQAVKALAHVGMTGRQPDPCADLDRDHHSRLLFASAFISAATVETSTAPAIRIRPPVANSMSMTPAFSGVGAGDAGTGSDTIATGITGRGH